MAPAGGDQLAAALGTLEHGWMPGITSIDHIADDVHSSNLNLPMEHLELGEPHDGAFINSKGFGGNNATGFFLGARTTTDMLTRRWGKQQAKSYRKRHEAVAEQASTYDSSIDTGSIAPIYRFGQGVLSGEDLDLSEDAIAVPGFAQPINLKLANPYGDMTQEE
jgi:acetoacetyl-[acyl-carrier protein] synthase